MFEYVVDVYIYIYILFFLLPLYPTIKKIKKKIYSTTHSRSRDSIPYSGVIFLDHKTIIVKAEHSM